MIRAALPVLLFLIAAATPTWSAPQSELGVDVPPPPPEPDGPQLSWQSVAAQLELDVNIEVVQQPVFSHGDLEVRATWAVFWMDRDRSEELTDPSSDRYAEMRDKLRNVQEDLEARPLIPTLFEAIEEAGFDGVVRELYLEGPIEFFVEGERQAHASAIYLDLVTGHGWIADANVSVQRNFGGKPGVVRAIAAWMRHSKDGSLRADSATVTTSEFDVPPVFITTKDLRITPFKEGDETFVRVELDKNRLSMYDLPALPLPPLSFDTDEEFKPLIGSLRIGDSARNGFTVGTTFTSDLGRLGRRINLGLGGHAEGFRGDVELDVSYLNSRGIFADLGFELESRKDYWWWLRVGGIIDDGDDRGLVRVDEDERDDLRLWYRSRARYLFGEKEWLDFVFSHQTDPGVQAEFWEGAFQRFEERESYLHYRKARDEDYFFAILQARTDRFRSQVDRLPQLGYQRSRTEVADTFGLPIVYSTSATAAYLKRREGDVILNPVGKGEEPLYASLYLDGPFPDGPGEQSALRFDNTHRLEAPFELGFWGLRAVPFTEGRYTHWSDDFAEEDNAGRGAVFGGLRLSTTAWRMGETGHYYEVSPFVEYRRDLAFEESGDAPAFFDAVELSPEGHFVSGGVRARWRSPGATEQLDVELEATYAEDRPTGAPEGLLPVAAFARLNAVPFGVPMQLFEDFRYDLDDSRTVYSLLNAGFELSEDLDLVAGHRRAIDQFGDGLLESSNVALRYTWSPKWQYEVEQVFSGRADGQDVISLLVRRFGHDFVLDLEFSRRDGEGGSSIGLNLRPVLGWRPSSLGRQAFLRN